MNLKDLSLEERHKIKKRLGIYAALCKTAVVICLFLICAFSLLPAKNVPHTNIFPLGDKGAHAIAYIGLGMFAFLSISFSLIRKHLLNQKINEVKETLFATLHVLLIGIPLGLIIEIIQAKVGRNFDLFDWLADSVGLLIGCIIAAIINKLVVTYIIKKVSVVSK
jgi:VanZ family protein